MTSSTPEESTPASDAAADLRLLWVTANHPPNRGGMAWSCDRIVRGLRARGATVDVVHLVRPDHAKPAGAGGHRGGGWTTSTALGGSTRRVPLGDDPEHALRRGAAELGAAAAEAGWTHLVAFGGTWPLLAAPVWAAWLDVPLVTLLRGNDFDTGVLSARRRGIVLDCLERSSAVCAVARSQAALVDRLVACRPGGAAGGPRATVVANGIDLDEWQALPSERAAADAWRAAHVDGGRRTIGLIGQLKAKKGVDWFIDRIDETGTGADVHLVLAGDCDDATARRIEAPPRDLTVSRLGFLDRFELLSVLPACDVVAVPSFYDGLPNVALEAAGLGVPLLCSDAGGLADLVDDGVEGFRFVAGDRATATDALERCLEADRDHLDALGRAARRRTARDFSAAAEIDGYLGVLTGTVDTTRPTPITPP